MSTFTNFAGAAWSGSASGTNTGDVTLAAVDSAPNANGAVLTGQQLQLEPADGSHPGVLTSSAQTIGGAKTFSGGVVTDAVSSATATAMTFTSTEAEASHGNSFVFANAANLTSSSKHTTWQANSGTELQYLRGDGALFNNVQLSAPVIKGDSIYSITGSTTMTLLPGQASGTDALVVNTQNTYSAGNILNVKNNGTSKLAVDFNGKQVLPTGGAAAVIGTATLVAGTVTVSTTAVTASSIILLTRKTAGGTVGDLRLGTVTAGTSFVINSASGTDTSTVNWLIFN